MHHGPHRQKAAPVLGATLPGLEGPFGIRPRDDEPPDDDGLVPDDPASDRPDERDVDARIRRQVQEAADRRERRKRERQQRQQARRAGLAQRHAAKLAHLEQRDRQNAADAPVVGAARRRAGPNPPNPPDAA